MMFLRPKRHSKRRPCLSKAFSHFSIRQKVSHIQPIWLKPEYAEAHDNLGVALSQIPGRQPDAIAEFQAALRTKPNYADARNNLARALAQTPGRLPDAIAEYEAALRANADEIGRGSC